MADNENPVVSLAAIRRVHEDRQFHNLMADNAEFMAKWRLRCACAECQEWRRDNGVQCPDARTLAAHNHIELVDEEGE